MPATAELPDHEAQLRADIGACVRDPLRYVLYNWPGLDLRQWQVDDLTGIGNALRDKPHDAILSAIASGHGIGKGCDGALLAHWAVSTREMTRGIVTANTESQLRTKTWPELAKWHGSALNRHWFTCTATALYQPEFERNWRLDAIPWSMHNTEAFAGLHNQGHRILVWFDEASAIGDPIWDVAEGALTDEQTEILWLVRGNPTRNSGRFYESCFGARRHRWMTRSIDARTVEGTNKAQIAKWAADYGEDSDFFRVRVRGLPPSASEMQFIERTIIDEAMQREPVAGLRDPLIMAVDIARGGNDNLVIAYRRGLDAKGIPWVVIPGSETRNSERVIGKIIDLATTSDDFRRPDYIMVDGTGVGGPIVNRLQTILGDSGGRVLEVQFAGHSPNDKLANLRMYMWWQMRESLRLGLAIPNDPILGLELGAPEVWHDKRDRLIMESKEDLKDRLPEMGSPDRADALAISFAYNVQPRQATQVRGMAGKAKRGYDVQEWA